ncbi:MAG: hypothetical protein ACJ75B_10295 [Flavisolibacter sp.]
MTRCLVYYYSNRSKKEIFFELGLALGWPIEENKSLYPFQGAECYVGIHRSEDAASPGEEIEKGNYRAFPYYIDFSCDELEDEDLVPLVRRVLQHLWKLNIPAVAEAGFEEELPYNGGSKNEEMNWPSHGLVK